MREVGLPETQFRASFIPWEEEEVHDLMRDFVEGEERSV